MATKTKKAFLIYPHQLFQETLHASKDFTFYLIEEPLFFTQYKFHKQKIMLHRASMKSFAAELKKSGRATEYGEVGEIKKTEDLVKHLTSDQVESVEFYDLVDDWLETRLTKALEQAKINYEILESPNFICTRELIDKYFKSKKSYFLHHFYIAERKRLKILLGDGDEPAGGKWSLDQENRNKIKKGEVLPEYSFPKENEFVKEARKYTEEHFKKHYGETEPFVYPINREDALKGLEDFLENRFEKYGTYQDAILKEETFLFHSLLTPALNVGLLNPKEILDEVLAFAKKKSIPLNSVEGFVRQVMGWREFIRGVYRAAGRKERTRNFWKHSRKIPESFWTGETGIEPVDVVIKRIDQTAYAHHIERLMILGNFMLLCEFDPDEVYRWFMELFIDAYDWVMVSNVYGMSQFADGGLMATKPYISSSNYVLKMSDFKKGEWCEVWDGLFWRFIDKHKKFFAGNPRMLMMTKTLERMKAERRKDLFEKAEAFLSSLDESSAC